MERHCCWGCRTRAVVLVWQPVLYAYALSDSTQIALQWSNAKKVSAKLQVKSIHAVSLASSHWAALASLLTWRGLSVVSNADTFALTICKWTFGSLYYHVTLYKIWPYLISNDAPKLMKANSQRGSAEINLET